ncbi:MAG: 4Fe-4S binding protein [Desulfatibacillaceae bacterium]|nr:4Fe-4S binding protein [Desulfatibacillaceae bacterium]
MKPSSRDILKRHGLRIDKAAHNFLYFYYHKHYVAASLFVAKNGARFLGWIPPFRLVPRAVFNRYHSKVLSRDDVKKILSLDHDINLGADESRKVIPFRYAHNVIFRDPKLIAVMDCPCKLNQPESERCQPLACCIAIGKDFAPIWLEHCAEKYHARQITQQDALDIISAARNSGHITQAFIKTATGGLTGIICNCCPSCCGGIKASAQTVKIEKGLTQYIASGYSVARDEAACNLCGKCEKACPFDLIKIKEKTWRYDQAACLGCELCVEKCPQQALSLFKDPEKLLPLDISLLESEFATQNTLVKWR